MSQVRAVVELLAKIFRENGTSKIRAETFRQSKFNDNEAVPVLWKLLFELIYFCEYGKIEDVTIQAAGKFTKEELVVYVKKELQKRGFFSQDFARLPNDQAHGSREILLALGWLLCKESIINQFMLARTSPLDDDTTRLHRKGEKVSNSTLSLQPSQDPVERVQQLLWLNNKLRLSLRSLHALQQENIKLKHKIHESTEGVSAWPDRNHLSMLEIYMLRHPELLNKNLQLLEHDNMRLQNLLKWKECEDVFWKWMESVLDAKLQDKTCVSDDGNGLNIEPLAPLNLGALKQTHSTLRDAILKYEGIVDHLELLCQCKSAEVTEEELDAILSSINLELSIQRANISLNNCASYVHQQEGQQHVPMFRYMPETTAKHLLHAPVASSMSSVATAASTTTGVEDVRNIEEEIGRMEGMLEKMQNEITLKKNKFQEELHEISAKFKDVICIPPMARKPS